MKTTLSKIRAFTLIELLVTIAIIALLTGIVVTSLAPSKGKARDVKRISDLGNIQLAISLYFDRCKEYPSAISGDLTQIKNGCPTTTPQVNLASYISTIPTSPAPGAYSYTVSSSKDDYVLAATLEKYNEILKDDIDANALSVACGTANNGDGANEVIYCLGPK